MTNTEDIENAKQTKMNDLGITKGKPTGEIENFSRIQRNNALWHGPSEIL